MDNFDSSSLQKLAERTARLSVAIQPRKSVQPALQMELDAFEAAIAEISPANYKLLKTRRVSEEMRDDIWKQYVSGIKLTKEESHRWHDEIEPTVQANLQAIHLQEQTPEVNITRSALKEFLRQLDIPEEMAKGTFENNIESSLDQFTEQINMDGVLAMNMKAFIPEKKNNILAQTQVHTSQFVLEHSKDVITASKVVDTEMAVEPSEHELIETSIDTFNKKEKRITLDKTIQFLDDLLTQAREYATGLVAPVEYYLDLAQELRDDLEWEQQETANKKAVVDVLTKLNRTKFMKQLLNVPVYVHQAQTDDQETLATMIMPQFENETLNNGYTWLWQHMSIDGLRRLQESNL